MRNSLALTWPKEGLTRVPYALYGREDVYAEERASIFRGPSWSYLCLEVELPNPGDYRATFVGDIPVIVARDMDGSLNAFENRCAHRGALLCFKRGGHGREISCVYHNWTYDLRGNLIGVAFERGIDRKGGMPPDFKREDHALRRLRVENFAGLVFGTFSPDAPTLADYLGEAIAARIRRVLCKPVAVLGYSSQMLPNNWKIYVENNRDSYHASLLHTFFTTFRVNRLSQEGGIIVDDSGGHHVSYSKRATDKASREYDSAKLRASRDDYRLADPSLLDGRDEFGDGITLQILTVFPTFVLQQVQNSLAVRQVVPRGVGQTELFWTHLGFTDDDAAMRAIRLKQSNLVGPGGYISLEDGAVGGFIQRALPASGDESSIVTMGGADARSQDTRATETAVRGFWKAYRGMMGV
ncbi:MAG TPA: aromatic ring-hydroxylating dioxygenase subunit alpha [Stellaceae bacterium]|nr:aromatic ring-hydroxylating dioxygenase subunit alpha [Stellaceae bacterium]